MNTNDLISNRHGNVTGPKRTADLRDFQTSFISVVVACTILSLTSSRDNSADSIGTGAFEGNEWKVCYFQKFANREKFANLLYGGGPGAIEARQLYSYASVVVLGRCCGGRLRGEGWSRPRRCLRLLDLCPLVSVRAPNTVNQCDVVLDECRFGFFRPHQRQANSR